VKILPVKVLNCSGYSSDVANGIKWAVDQGARVINLSLGAPGPNPVLDAAVAYANAHRAVVVAAAGNNHGPKSCSAAANNARSYPGASPGAIGVGAVGKRLTRACFSNTGNYLDLVAPGTKVLSTYPPAMTRYGYAPYMYMNGTSMAAPHVSAAAALVLSRRPGCSPARVEQRLKATARRFSAHRRTNAFGYGLVSPGKAVSGNAC
jgi:subtilisin family serine protease